MRRATWIAVLLLSLALLLLAASLVHNYQGELAQRVEFRKAELQTGFTTIVDGYRQVVEAFLHQSIQTPDVLDIVAAANGADAALQQKLRGRLYRRLYPVYGLLRDRDIRVLQFVLADGRSLLRFNRPDLYGDDIGSDRTVIHRVLTERRPLQSFENGRVYPGFRYVFPLVRDGRVIGAVDFSAAFDALHRVLVQRKAEQGAFSRFLIRRDLMLEVVHPSSQALFQPTPIHPDLVVEDEHSILRDIRWVQTTPDHAAELDRAMAANPDVRRAIETGTATGTHACLADAACYIVAVDPVRDSLDRPAAFIVAYTPADELASIRHQRLTAFLAGSLLLIGAGRLFHHWLASRQRLQTISQHMAQGMYVMDRFGRVVYSNAAAAELLGYSERELGGRTAHALFHVPSGECGTAPDDCPIRRVPLEGGTFTSDNEQFRRRDGSLIRVGVTASPLREDGKITAVVVLFHDITAEHRTRMRLRQSDIAFRNLAEGVLLADADGNIQAVNQAFTAITGYSEEEVVGRNPRMLSSGQHDPAFYEAMWKDIRGKGSWQGEIWNRRKNGEIYPEWLNINAIHGDNGEIVSYVTVFSDITEMRRKEAKLRDLAFHDQLTGLPNRTSFHDLFEHALQRARRQGTRLALLYLDLDRFKQINDTLGHLVGDKLLQAVALRIQRNVRAEDVVARLGGDELTVLIEGVPSDDTPARVGRKLLDTLRQPIEVDHKQLFISASIGISVYPQDGEDTVTLMKNADAAMYLAKHRGRNDYGYFTVSMAREAEERFALEHDLRVALREHQFLLFYQPKARSQGCGLIGLEALLRWHHPRRGLLSPALFLEVAQEAGLMPEITDWLVGEACHQLVAWRGMGLSPGRIAINLDDQTFNAAGAPRHIETLVRAAGAVPEDLELEITERVMVNRESSQVHLEALVAAGFELSIDDFGTGESSLFRLKHLPVRTLKVDKSFVDDIDRNESDRAILRSIVTMARSLGKLVLAEGVERESQLRLLQEVGCDFVQGYFIARPAPPEALTGMLAARAGHPGSGHPTSVARLRPAAEPCAKASATAQGFANRAVDTF